MDSTRVCLNCGGELDRQMPGAVMTTVKRLYCRRCREPEPTALDAIWSTFGFALLAVVVACFVAFVFAPPKVFAGSDLPRWAVVKWQRGVPLMATFEPQTKAQCEDIAAKRSAAYAHAGVTARWTCEDLRPNEKSA